MDTIYVCVYIKDVNGVMLSVSICDIATCISLLVILTFKSEHDIDMIRRYWSRNRLSGDTKARAIGWRGSTA